MTDDALLREKITCSKSETPPFTSDYYFKNHHTAAYNTITTSIVWSAATHVHCYGKLKAKLGSGIGNGIVILQAQSRMQYQDITISLLSTLHNHIYTTLKPKPSLFRCNLLIAYTALRHTSITVLIDCRRSKFNLSR